MRFLADENFNNHIIRALLLQKPAIDIVRVQDVGLSGQDDSAVMERALLENRILLTHDVKTIPRFAIDRLDNGHSIPAIILILWDAPIGKVIADIVLMIECSEQHEWENQIVYLPF